MPTISDPNVVRAIARIEREVKPPTRETLKQFKIRLNTAIDAGLSYIQWQHKELNR